MTSAYTVYMIRDAWFYICCNLFLFVAITADICNIDRNRPTFHSEKKQTQMNFLFWLGKWFNFIRDIIIHFQNICFEIVTTRELPSSVKLTKITDTLCKMEVYGLLCNARSYLLFIRVHRILIIENTFTILIKVLHDPQRQVKETVLCSKEAILITCSGKNSCRKGPSKMMPSPSGSNLVFMRFTLRQKHWI